MKSATIVKLDEKLIENLVNEFKQQKETLNKIQIKINNRKNFWKNTSLERDYQKIENKLSKFDSQNASILGLINKKEEFK